eukprot:1181603-Prorocentrum_minimum.AAC.1
MGRRRQPGVTRAEHTQTALLLLLNALVLVTGISTQPYSSSQHVGPDASASASYEDAGRLPAGIPAHFENFTVRHSNSDVLPPLRGPRRRLLQGAFLGQFQVGRAYGSNTPPHASDTPQTYTCVEVCQLLFPAGSAYYAFAGSTSDSTITNTCNGDKHSFACQTLTNVQSDNYKNGATYSSSGAWS